MKRFYVVLFIGLISPSVFSAEFDCNSLSEWSSNINGVQVNQKHVFCGDLNSKNRAVGFHSFPSGDQPSTYISSTPADKVNDAGVYTLREIKLNISERRVTKSFSSMFPDNCTVEQVNNTIVYAHLNSPGRCSNPGWASCGPNGPKQGGDQYCFAKSGKAYQVATATLRSDKKKINTGFPIYQP